MFASEAERCFYESLQIGFVDRVEKLIKEGVFVNTNKFLNHKGSLLTPLQIATSGDAFDLNMVSLLLQNGADPNLFQPRYSSPLKLALQNNLSLEVINLLIQYGADVDGYTLLDTATSVTPCYHDTVEKVESLLKAGADINFQNSDGASALMWTIFGSVKVIKCLVEKGINVNLQSNDGNTALHLIASDVDHFRDTERAQIAQMLIQHGALVNVANTLGFSPLVMRMRTGFARSIGTREVILWPTTDQERFEESFGMEGFFNMFFQHGTVVNEPYFVDALKWLIQWTEVEFWSCILKLAIRSGLRIRELPSVQKSVYAKCFIHNQTNLKQYMHEKVQCIAPLSELCKIAIRNSLIESAEGRSIYKNFEQLGLPQCLVEYLQVI